MYYEIQDPEINNKYPYCVSMELHIEEISATTSEPTDLKELNVSLAINFSGDQEVLVPGQKYLPEGKVSFGIKRGQLRFTFSNCELPIEKVELCEPFNVCFEVEQQRTQSRGIQMGITLESQSFNSEFSGSSSSKKNVKIFQVRMIGDKKEPAWIFESCDDYHILKGTLRKTLLGPVVILSLPSCLTATFTVRGDDISLTWGEMGSVKNIKRNKLAVIERAIAMRYLQPLLESTPLCEGWWKYG